MLVAKDALGARKVASSGNRSDGYTCPDCKQSVTMRIGPKRVAHFAHRAGQECSSERIMRERREAAQLRRQARKESYETARGQQVLF